MSQKASVGRSVLLGAVAGLAGSLAMAGYQEIVARVTEGEGRGDHGAHAPLPGQENTTETAARRVARQFGHTLRTADKQLAGRALHYGFGALMGAVYGVAAEYLPVLGLAGGTAFGTVLFLGTDEAMLPLLGLASQPQETPAADHLLHWSSHVVYSTTMELTRRGLQRLS